MNYELLLVFRSSVSATLSLKTSFVNLFSCLYSVNSWYFKQSNVKSFFLRNKENIFLTRFQGDVLHCNKLQYKLMKILRLSFIFIQWSAFLLIQWRRLFCLSFDFKQTFFKLQVYKYKQREAVNCTVSLCFHVCVYPCCLTPWQNSQIEIKSLLHCVAIYDNDCRYSLDSN